MSYFSPYVHVFNQQKELYTTPTYQRSPSTGHRQQSLELSRLLTAAVVNQRFCQLLLTDPAAALEQGFNGESFSLSPEERAWVVSIQATTLQGFAEQLLASPYSSRTPEKETVSPEEEAMAGAETPIETVIARPSTATPLVLNRLRKAS